MTRGQVILTLLAGYAAAVLLAVGGWSWLCTRAQRRGRQAVAARALAEATGHPSRHATRPTGEQLEALAAMLDVSTLTDADIARARRDVAHYSHNAHIAWGVCRVAHPDGMADPDALTLITNGQADAEHIIVALAKDSATPTGYIADVMFRHREHEKSCTGLDPADTRSRPVPRQRGHLRPVDDTNL